jgi:hypothetical protein
MQTTGRVVRESRRERPLALAAGSKCKFVDSGRRLLMMGLGFNFRNLLIEVQNDYYDTRLCARMAYLQVETAHHTAASSECQYDH